LNKIPNKKKIKDKPTIVLKKTYFPTINGKRVEGVTITTINGTAKRKNFEILNELNINI